MKNKKPIPLLTEEQRRITAIMLGYLAGVFSKSLLESQGVNVNYKINGEDISSFGKLGSWEIQSRLELAIKEERYEDAAKFKKLLDGRKNNK